MSKIYIISSLLTIFVFGALFGQPIAAQELKKSKTDEFIKIFKHAEDKKEQVTVISDEVFEFIKSCCNDEAAAVQLLEKSGFKVSIPEDKQKISSLNEHWKTEKEYDGFVFGKKQSGWWPFWDVFTSYEVAIFLSDKKVEKVFASTIKDLPF